MKSREKLVLLYLAKGFTLLELLIVITTIGIISAVTIVSFSSNRDDANLKKTMQWAGNINSSVGAYAAGAWNFDSVNGSTIYDNSGNGNNGAVNGSVLLASSVAGNGFNFNGANYINCGNSNSIKVTTSMTLSFWAKPSSVSSPSRQNPICKSYGGEFCITMEPSGQLSYYHGSCGGNCSPYMSFATANVFKNNEWVHIVLVRDNFKRRMYLYKNGKQVNTTTWVATNDPKSSALNFQIGAGYVNRFYGIIDEVGFYKEAFTQAQIEKIYAEGFDRHKTFATVID